MTAAGNRSQRVQMEGWRQGRLGSIRTNWKKKKMEKEEKMREKV